MQAVLAERIDRLGEREKQVLQTAAVIGKTFACSSGGKGARRFPGAIAAARHSLVGDPGDV